jgi:MFS-type transporter involved in bile tolerance (Atg22 family)
MAKRADVKWIRRLHLVMACVWLILAVPTILWWKDSVLWVAILSLYANFAAEASGYQGARAEQAAEE